MSDFITQEVEDGSGGIHLYDPDYDYYSVDNILEEDVLLKVKTITPIPHAELFRECDKNGCIPANTELDLPAWLVLPLICEGSLELMEPKEFGSQFLSQVWADPSAVNIRSKCPMFYSLGSKYAQLTHNPSLLMLLLRSFLDRSQMISKTAQSQFDKDNTIFLQKLSNSEQSLFRSLVRSVSEESIWWKKGCQETKYTLVEHTSKRQHVA